MSKPFKNLLATGVVTLGIAALGMSTVTWAAAGDSAPSAAISDQVAALVGNSVKPHCFAKMKQAMWQDRMNTRIEHQLGLAQQDKQLTKDDAKTLVEAALIMIGRKDLSVGTVAPVTTDNRTEYRVDIVDKSNKTVSQTLVNGATGFMHPVSAKTQQQNATADNQDS